MDKQKLTDLKSNIMQELLPLAESSGLAPEQKFDLLLNTARISGDATKLEAAYDTVKSVEDSNKKFNMLMDLLEEVDLNLSATGEQPEIPQENQDAEHHQQ